MREFFASSMFYGAAVSLLAYELGLVLKKKFRLAVLNPLLIAVTCVIGVNLVLGVDYQSYNASGQYLSYLLTPATVCLAVPLYEQLSLLKENLKAVVCGIVSGTLASLLGVLACAKLFGLDHELYVTLLPKSITTAIGMGVSQELGGIVTITVASIIITGILGNVIADGVFKVIRIQEPVAKGLALGNSAHAIGTARAMELGAVEGAMSSLAIAVAGLLTVVGAVGVCAIHVTCGGDNHETTIDCGGRSSIRKQRPAGGRETGGTPWRGFLRQGKADDHCPQHAGLQRGQVFL